MRFEIERKFRVIGSEWQRLATSETCIRQAYLNSTDKSSIRVRIRDNRNATLTIKSRPASLRRMELEYPIPVLEAEALMNLRVGTIIEKVRYEVRQDSLIWEIDVFAGENTGLIIAEIELNDEHQNFQRPGWIGDEITGQWQYYNGALVQHPFRSWSAEMISSRALVR